MNSILRLSIGISCLVATSVLGVAAGPHGWARFHGVDGRGDAGDAKLPAEWTADDYTWRRDLGSRDVGSPIIFGDNVYYLTSRPNSAQIALESVDVRNGKLRWAREFEQTAHHLHKRNTFASSTPASDADYVFAAWAEPAHTYLKCFDHDGNEVWSRDFGPWQSQHGFGTSPRIHGDLVLLMNSQQAEQLKPGQSPGESRVIAVSRSTGETVWETELDATRSCYGVPAVFKSGGMTQIIDANTGNGMFGLDAETGKMLWNLKVFEMRCCSTPLILDDVAIGSSGSGGGGNHLVAVRIPTKPGQEPEQIYRIDRGAPYVPTPVLKDGRLFMIDDKGIASCVDAKTGEKIWMERIGGNFGASPLLVGDTLLLISLDGQATLVRASDRFEEIGKFDLGGPVGASPAFADGRLLLRIGNEIACLGGKAI